MWMYYIDRELSYTSFALTGAF
ncbi:hypothetical protein MPC4_340032 [Methylocella tundrae]|uniref:Uncharacterized protein n=1 Tax=Methylocella tundrae TaxID=227605 RepID=A0A8B6MB28_METTU|nr:hypothetical protein MPC4_340032 [Methylocella tundrae]